MTRNSVRNAVEELLGREARRLVKNDLPIPGPNGDHEFDVGAGNGRPYFAARALSFEGGREGSLLRQIESTAWAIEDVKKAEEDLPLAVVVLPPKEDHAGVFGQAVRAFQKLQADVIEESQVTEWAASMAKLVSASWRISD